MSRPALHSQQVQLNQVAEALGKSNVETARMESSQALQCPVSVLDRPHGEVTLLYLTAISLIATSVQCISS